MITLEEITVIGAPIERCFDLARNVEVHLAGNLHCEGSAVATAGTMSGLVALGERVTWRAKHLASGTNSLVKSRRWTGPLTSKTP